MSRGAEREPQEGPPERLTRNLAYLLKHAQLLLAEAAGPALASFGIDGRELAVLTVLADDPPLSQQQAALRLGIDRTTMVAMIDGLEGKGLVRRHPAPGDRRKNIVELTADGRDTHRRAGRAFDGAEGRFLAPLGDADAERLKDALHILVSAPTTRLRADGQQTDAS